MLSFRKVASRAAAAATGTSLTMGSIISILDRGGYSHKKPLRHCSCKKDTPPLEEQNTLAHHREWMKTMIPAFKMEGDNIQVLKTPSEFYNTLKAEANRAKHRVVISSLYLGTGQLEKDLVRTLEESLKRTPNMEVQILLDYTRGSRGKVESSRTMLLPLLRGINPNVNISLYHTPNLRGWLKAVLPERYNETVGLQHMKVYLFDDNVLLSGANLSDSYFTNRQDRYVIFRNVPHLSNFFADLVQTVASFSMQLQEDNSVDLAKDQKYHPFKDKDGGAGFRRSAQDRISSLLKRYETADQSESEGKSDTWVFPMIQMGQLGIDLDHEATQKLIHELPARSRVRLASGYFNLTDDYVHDVVHHSQATFDILTAAPKANGFFGAGGFAGAIPDAYTYILKQFFHVLQDTSQSSRIRLFEYLLPGWTFHAKGMWCYLPDQLLPSITLIGSPNFGYRSRYRDLEAQVAILTVDPNLQQQLEDEQSGLYEPSTPVNQQTFDEPNRRIPYWVKVVTNIIKHFF